MHDARGCAAPEGECVYIRQSMSACVITNIHHFRTLKNWPNLKENCSAIFIVWIVGFDCDF